MTFQRPRVDFEDFSSLYNLHNGDRFLAPVDLAVAPALPRRVLIVGSCLAEVWKNVIECPSDFVMTNNLSELPDSPPQPIENYDLQLVQISLRDVMREAPLWHTSFLDLDAYEKAFEERLTFLRHYLALACAWNKKHGILTFVANFLVPQQNPMGRLFPRYDLRNPVYFVEQLNVCLAREIDLYENTCLLDIDSVAAVFGKKNIQDDGVDIYTHASLLGDAGYDRDQDRIDPIYQMTKHYGLLRDQFLTAVWRQAAAQYKTLRQEDVVKLVIIDLDNTLWRGVVAEEGQIDHMTTEGWPLGLMEALCFLKKRGILLAIASRNEEGRIVELWDKMMHGRFHLSDFAVTRINWQPKTENIEEILKLTNILPHQTVFIDDNPVERAAVKAAFPDIRVLGKYPYYLKRILLWSPETQVANISKESSQRTEMMQSQVKREGMRKAMSREDFLKTLEVKAHFVEISSIDHPAFPRSFELINKTNQFNTTGRRWTREECDAFFRNGNSFYSFEVKDRLSNYGLVGCFLVAGNLIEQFVMSCRVVGLDVELATTGALIEHLRDKGFSEIQAQLIETQFNFPCRNLFERCGFFKRESNWVLDLDSLAVAESNGAVR